MLYRRSAQLALQALFFLALDRSSQPRLVRDIAAALGVQPAYLTKIFQQLQRVGLVSAVRGPRGGVRLLRPADQIKLWDVISALEPVDMFERCLLGLARCSDRNPCPLHSLWAPIRAQLLAMLQTKNVSELAWESQRNGLLPWLPSSGQRGETRAAASA